MTYNFRLTRERSTVSSKYDFEFIGNSRLAVVPVLQRYEKGYRIIGTGSYFIRPNTFITAARIFEGDDIKPSDSFYIVSEAVLDYPLKVIEIYKYESFDCLTSAKSELFRVKF